MNGFRLRPGARVLFEQAEHTVIGLDGATVKLRRDDGHYWASLVTTLRAAEDFAVIGEVASTDLSALAGIAHLTTEQAETLHWWHGHITEMVDGLPHGSSASASPRPQYDPSLTSMTARVAAKTAELAANGTPVSSRTLERKAARLRASGMWGLIDQRRTRLASTTGRADPRVVAGILACLDQETMQSTGTTGRLHRRVQAALVDEHGAGAVELPSRATFYRLVKSLEAGRHTFGDAPTRRSLANRPDRMFAVTTATRPGEQIQIDSTPLDVLVLFDDGISGRAELTIGIDIATRSICAAVLRPQATKAVDAAILLARMLVPEPLRPGWDDSLALSRSVLPHEQLIDADTRMRLAAAKPVIVPETIVVDHGKAFQSATFINACQMLAISVQPAAPRTPTDKGVVERTFESINTLFTQYLAGYTGRAVSRRGASVEDDVVWPVAELQDLIDQWVIASWQNRPHDALRDPLAPSIVLSPNEMYSAMVAATGSVMVPFTTEDYIALMPCERRTVNVYGIRLGNRTYDAPGLRPYRQQRSGQPDGKWEIRQDPYDLARAWLRDDRTEEWITLTWTQAGTLAQPMADFVWKQARQIAASRGHRDETAIRKAADELLTLAETGPGKDNPRDRRISARNAAAQRQREREHLPVPEQTSFDESVVVASAEAGPDDGGPIADVIPFAVFDAAREAGRYR